MMNRSIIILSGLVYILLMSCSTAEVTTVMNDPQLINKNWEFLIDSADVQSPDEINANQHWTKVNIPHTPRIEPLLVNDQWQGTCWYKKELEYQPEWQNQEIFLRFEGAMNVAEVWVNGTKKIKHQGGYLPFVINISNEIKKDHANTIYVRLNNEDNEVTGPKPLFDLDFNMYGGIYRDVWLLVKPPVHISDEQYANQVAGGGIFVTYPEVSSSKARVQIKTNLFNAEDKPLRVKIEQILKKDNKKISSTEKEAEISMHSSLDVTQLIELANPELWSIQTPELYTLETILKKENKIIDRQSTRIGIRKIEFRENKLYLNDEEVYLRGVNRHQEYPYLGYALSDDANYRDAYKIKQAGFDYVRLSHYPHTKAFLDACDELGILVLDAILGWQYYREYDPFRNHVLQTCRDLIRRDRNHPSVFAWEVSLNESWMPEEFIDSLTFITHQEYPGDDCYAAGWQRYGFDIYLQARQHRIGHSDNKIPDKPYIVSEYGDWEYYALNAGLNQDAWSDLLPDERSSRQLLGSGEKELLQQALNHQEAHNSNFETPAIADGYWAMFDYNRGYADDLEASGVMSIFRVPKFSYYFFQSQRDPYEPIMGERNSPMVHIASYYNENSSRNIRVFSNCDEVELIQDKTSLGKQSPDANAISDNLRHPPFTFNNITIKPGQLTAIAYLDGEEVARHTVTSNGEPAQLIIEADLSGRDWKSGCNDAIFLHARIVDQNEQTIPDYTGKISFSISGEASIIGDTSPVPEAGIASILAIASETPGSVIIRAISGDITSEKFTVNTKASEK